MLSRLFMRLVTMSPRLRRVLWRGWYQLLARRFPLGDWAFMNYGFAPSSPAPTLALRAEDEADRLAIQLYHHVAGALPIAGASVLEVGCGRGGGASYIARYLGPAEVVGVDYSARNVDFCRARHRRSGAAFELGDAEALPFPDERFDIVVNVESSHCYGDMDRFVSEVRRVLRPGGHFAWADMRPRDDLPDLRRTFAESGLTRVSFEDITANVLRALALADEFKTAAIAAHVWAPLRRAFGNFAGVRDSKVYAALSDGSAVYMSAVFRK